MSSGLLEKDSYYFRDIQLREVINEKKKTLQSAESTTNEDGRKHHTKRHLSMMKKDASWIELKAHRVQRKIGFNGPIKKAAISLKVGGNKNERTKVWKKIKHYWGKVLAFTAAILPVAC